MSLVPGLGRSLRGSPSVCAPPGCLQNAAPPNSWCLLALQTWEGKKWLFCLKSDLNLAALVVGKGHLYCH